MLSSWEGSAGSSSDAARLVDADDDSCVEIPLGVRRSGVVAQSEGEGSLDHLRGFGVDSFGPVSCATPIMAFLSGDGSSPQSTLDEVGHLRIFRRSFSIPRWVSLHAPNKHLLANSYVPRMVCMYQFPFNQGLRLPLPQLVVDFCDYHAISPGQLMPNAWRVLLGFQVLAELEKLDVNVYDVKHSYEVKPATDKGRIQIQKRKGVGAPVLGIEHGVKGWKNKFIFMSYEALGIPDGKEIPAAWSTPRRLNTIPVILGLEDRAKRFLEVPEGERYWQVLLVDSNLKRTTLWKEVPPLPEGTYVPPTRTHHEIVLGLRSWEIITGRSNPINVDKLTPGQQVYADTWMAEAKYRYDKNSMNHDEWVARRQKKKQKSKVGGTSGHGGQSIPVDAPEGSLPSDSAPVRGPVVPGKKTSSSGVVQVTVPIDASAQTGYKSLSGEFEKLLLKEDKDFIRAQGVPNCYDIAASTAFSSYQHTLFMKKQIGKLEKDLEDVKTNRAAIEENLRLAREELSKGKTEWEGTEAFLRGQLTLNEQEIRRLKAELASLEEEKEQDIQDACHETAVEIQGMMSKQYLNGEAANWPNDENITRWEELQRIRRGDPMVSDDTPDDE